MSDLFTGRKPQGASLELTIDAAVQQAADKALGSQRGAAVALDPKTGAILALVSHPSYDPNNLASHDLNKVIAASKTLDERRRASPLVDRPIAGDLYPPGSTFKVVTAAAALSSGKYTPQQRHPRPGYPRPAADLASTCPTTSPAPAARTAR